MRFDELPLDPALQRAVVDMRWEVLTPIQEQTIPPLLTGRDMIGCARTGSGKTGAFVLPILQRIVARPAPGIRALVLAPTRELADQIDETFAALGYYADVPCGLVQGGVDYGPQEKALKTGVPVIVATPGRLMDHLSRGYVSFASIEVFVLDEGDRMLDMGFLPDVRQILRWIPDTRQTMLFSATVPPEIAQLAREILRNPVEVRVETKSAPAAGVTQHLVEAADDAKLPWLQRFLRREKEGSILIFTRTKDGANRLARGLARVGVATRALHSGKMQEDRDATLLAFRNGTLRVLVATDVASRGLDIDRVAHVVNYDVPDEPDTYIHRVGRTGRYDATGDAWTLASPGERHKVRAIEQVLGRPIPREEGAVPAPDGRGAPGASAGSGSSHGASGGTRDERGGRRRRGGRGRGRGGNAGRPRGGAGERSHGAASGPVAGGSGSGSHGAP